MGLKGSKAEDNLKAAFAGESQANRRYLYFAQRADIEGHNDVAAVFRSTAEGETGPSRSVVPGGTRSGTRACLYRGKIVDFFLARGDSRAANLFEISALLGGAERCDFVRSQDLRLS